MATESGRAVVIDANFVGGGTFSATTFHRLANRLAARGHAVVVPEVVIWEWAQHMHEALMAAKRALTRANSAMDNALGVAVPELDVPSVRRSSTGFKATSLPPGLLRLRPPILAVPLMRLLSR